MIVRTKRCISECCPALASKYVRRRLAPQIGQIRSLPSQAREQSRRMRLPTSASIVRSSTVRAQGCPPLETHFAQPSCPAMTATSGPPTGFAGGHGGHFDALASSSGCAASSKLCRCSRDSRKAGRRPMIVTAPSTRRLSERRSPAWADRSRDRAGTGQGPDAGSICLSVPHLRLVR